MMVFNIKFQSMDQYGDINTYNEFAVEKNWTNLGGTIDKMLEADKTMKIISVKEDLYEEKDGR